MTCLFYCETAAANPGFRFAAHAYLEADVMRLAIFLVLERERAIESRAIRFGVSIRSISWPKSVMRFLDVSWSLLVEQFNLVCLNKSGFAWRAKDMSIPVSSSPRKRLSLPGLAMDKLTSCKTKRRSV